MGRTDRFVTVDGVEIHYSEWGAEDSPPIVCIHGMTRVGRDFDPLAAALEDEYRVLCPDMPGRGWSEWADDPETLYTTEAMAELCTGFCDALGLDTLRWVGTSMGGQIGIEAAGGRLADRITHLVVNDISPAPVQDADEKALEDTVSYVTDQPVFDTLSELEAYYRDAYEGEFGHMSAEEWQRFTVSSAQRVGGRKIGKAYDRRVMDPSLEQDDEGDSDPYDTWAAIEAELMVIRGKESGILLEEPFEKMLDLQPDAESLEVSCGHVPLMNVPEQIHPIRDFLRTNAN